MALTGEEVLSISMILGITPTLVEAQITSLGADLDATRETAIRNELDRWSTAGTAFVKIHPKESNKGVETNSGDAQGDIRKNLAVLLEFTTYYSTPSIGSIQLSA